MKTHMKWISCFFIVLAASLTGSLVLADATVNPGTQPAWSIGAFTLKQPNLQLGATNAYRTWFENGAWQGDLVEYDIDTSGNRSSDVTVGANPATDGTNNWSARFEFSNQEATVTDYWKAASGRKIITWDGSNQVAFLWDTILSGQRSLLDPATVVAGLTGTYDSPILNFVRGDRSLETPSGLLRKRFSLLGDPGKVQPLYVGAPSQTLQIAGHAQYKADNASRAGRVIVAANDGMIHVFDADTGIEVYAYVPSMLFITLDLLTELNYVHTWFADGQLASGDAQIGSTWKTVVAGGLGAGAKGLFALDVTTPTLSSETSIASADQKVIGEATGDALGYIHGKPGIAPLSNGTWYVISGNGYDSNNDTAVLVAVSLNDGSSFTIPTDGVTGNGLSAPALVDIDHDSDVDIAYAGDLLGNLWKFDLNNPGTAAELLFAAGASKPITTAPDVALHPNGGYLVYFGTGSLLSSVDAKDTSQQTVYAIWDYPNRSTTVTDGVDGNGNQILLSQTLSIDTHQYTDGGGASVETSVRLVTSNTPNWSYNRGWKTDLSSSSGERVIGDVQLRGNRLQFVSDLPTTTETDPIGESWLLELDWISGGDTGAVFIDLNNDGFLNNDDKVTLDDSSLAVPVGISLGLGNRSQPTFARVSNGADTIFINGVDLEVFTCEGECAGGLAGGHMDVDTDNPADGLGGGTAGHVHEYDDKYNVTFVNYFNLEPPNGDKLPRVYEVSIDETTEFVVVLANADLSPGGRITLDDRDWNVVDYQEMIQQRLLDYNGADSSTLVDGDGASLVFTLKGIVDNSGTLETSFLDRAIIQGGLHPSQTGCVKGNDIINDRWRNGALTFQLIQLDTIGNGLSENNTWIAQAPSDLVAGMVGGGLHANPANDSGFLYESTLFWHFGTLYKELTGEKGPCYGDANYAAAKEIETKGLTVLEFSALFPAYATQQDLIDSLVDQMANFTCAAGTGSVCKKEAGYVDLNDQLKALVGDEKLFLKLRPYLNEGGGTGDVGEGSGGKVATNVDGDGDTEEDLVLEGTPTGRISWIDLKL